MKTKILFLMVFLIFLLAGTLRSAEANDFSSHNIMEPIEVHSHQDDSDFGFMHDDGFMGNFGFMQGGVYVSIIGILIIFFLVLLIIYLIKKINESQLKSVNKEIKEKDKVEGER